MAVPWFSKKFWPTPLSVSGLNILAGICRALVNPRVIVGSRMDATISDGNFVITLDANQLTGGTANPIGSIAGTNVAAIEFSLTGVSDEYITGDPKQHHMDTATISTAGSGYTVGNVLTLSGGTSIASNTGKIIVTSVDGSGGLTGISITNIGSYSTFPATTNSPSGGSGTSAVLTITEIGTAQNILKPPRTRSGTAAIASETKLGTTFSYSYTYYPSGTPNTDALNCYRTSNDGTTNEYQRIVPVWVLSELILAFPCIGYDSGGTAYRWSMIGDGRGWAKYA